MCIQSNIQAQRRCDLCINTVWQVTSVVEARLLRFWEARNVKRGGELMWVDMLLVDVNIVDMINGLVKLHGGCL